MEEKEDRNEEKLPCEEGDRGEEQAKVEMIESKGESRCRLTRIGGKVIEDNWANISNRKCGRLTKAEKLQLNTLRQEKKHTVKEAKKRKRSHDPDEEMEKEKETSPRGPQEAPGGSQEAPWKPAGGLQEGPGRPPGGPGDLREAPGAKSPPRGPRGCPRGPQEPRKKSPSCRQEAIMSPQGGRKRWPRGPQERPSGH